MEGEDDRLVPVPCIQCGHRAFAGYELPGGHKVNLCFEHSQQFDAMNLRRMELLQQQIERAEDNIADVMGMPRPQRPPRIPAPRINVNQVNIGGDNYGVVNNATVGNIKNNLTIINENNAALAEQLRVLTNAIIASKELTDEQKRDAADLVSEMTDGIAKGGRSRAAMKAVATALSQMLAHSADLWTLWTAIEPHVN